MDVLPLKFRSPPPKPPRRRHSDQLSVSSSGTFPSSRKKLTIDSHCCNDDKYSSENSPSSCGSLPADWTPEFCRENKIEKLPVFLEQECSSKTVINNYSNDKSGYSDLILVNSKFTTNLGTSSHQRNCSKPLVINKCETPSIYLNSKKELSTFDDLKKHPNSLHVNYTHRRHNSDPLPSIIDRQDIFPVSPVSLSNCCNEPDVLFGSKENECLLKEIKSLKEINSKLWEHLCSIQSSVENSKKCSTDNSIDLSVSGLLTSVYESIRAKDAAMEDRIKVVLQERDNAIKDLDKMVHVVAESFEDKYSCAGDKSSDEEIRELLKEIEATCNPSKLLQQQRLLLSYLYRSKELKLDQVLHEMKLMVAERDSLKLKIQVLESELSQLKLSNEIWNADNRLWERSLLNSLCQVIQQRDVTMKNYNAHTIEFLKHRSSARKKSFDSEEINDCLQRLEGNCVKKIFSFSQNDVKKYSLLSGKSRLDETRFLKEEILILNSSLETEVEKRKLAEEKCVRLERLVSVLQKKLNGQNVGIPV